MAGVITQSAFASRIPLFLKFANRASWNAQRLPRPYIELLSVHGPCQHSIDAV